MRGSVGENCGKFLLLMWKNWRLQLRHPIQTIFEILVPVFFCAILVVVRSLVESNNADPSVFQSFDPTAQPINLWNIIPPEIPPGFPPIEFPSYFDNYTMAYSPRNANLKKIMKSVGRALNLEDPDKIIELKNSYDLETKLISDPNTKKVGIMFPDSYATDTKLPENIEFTLRFPSESITYPSVSSVNTWKTNLLFPLFQQVGPRERHLLYTAEPYYYQEGFLLLQSLISQEIITHFKGNKDITIPQVKMERYPYPSYINDILITVLKDMISLIIVLAFEFTAISIIKVITTEKEKQLKEAMKIMGLPSWLHWTAWFTKSFLFMIISVLLMTTLFKISAWYDENVPAVLPNCDFVLLFIHLTLFTIATITLCFAISVFFTKANMAAGIGGVLFFVFMIPHTILNSRYQELTLSTKLSASLMSNTAMAYGFQIICMFETTGEGLQWNNLFRTVTPDDNLTMAHIFMMLIIDSILYMCIALYVEAIFPGNYGVAKKWHFIFTWPFKKSNKIITSNAQDENKDGSRYEEEPTNLKAGINIRGLTKVYNKDKTAVNNMSLRMYEDQITVLLGHNGAGKTTTMSMLTGLEKPSGGTAVINDHDLRTEMDDVRSSLGLCPQHNILFDELTVAEHIYFFSRLKGMPSKAIDQEISDYLRLLQLEDKRNKQSQTLSGGMKRKLSVAVAFCGGSKVVMLDEPTAGMDPSARRALWELVESQKKGRTIMLTTHFMDEADLLGDRIAIMAAGELQCCGSSFFLKKRYGAGYRLIIDKLPQCNVNEVTGSIRQFLPHVKVESNIGSELTYSLNEEDSVHFENMLSNLEENLDSLGIGSYGISLTTLEEVFMKVGADNTLNNLQNGNSEHNGFSNGDVAVNINPKTQLLTGSKLLTNQIYAMVMKRILSTIRSWPLLLTQFLIPIILLIFAIISGQNSATNELPPLTFDLSTYSETVTILQVDGSQKEFKAATEWLSSRGYYFEEVENVTAHIMNISAIEPGTFKMSYIMGATFTENYIKAWFNNEPYHTPPLALNFVYNAICKAFKSGCEITVHFEPLPLTADSKFKLLQQGNNMGFQMAINIGFCMTFISAFYILFYVRERVCKAKHLQFVSGINIFTFWGVSYVWDWITYAVTVIGLLVTLICFQEDGFKEGDTLGNLIALFFFFGFGMLPFVYILSFFYDLPSTGFTRVILYTTVVGTFGFLIVEILYFDELDLVYVAKILDWIFLFVPHYALSSGIRNSNMEYQRFTTCSKLVDACVANYISTHVPPNSMEILEDECWKNATMVTSQCIERETHYFDWNRPGILRNIILTLVIGLLLNTVLFLIEFKMFERILYFLQPKSPYTDVENTDNDVAAEMDKIRHLKDSEIKNYNLVLRNMTKYYKNFPAVKGLCLGVNKFECFGLLGINGAGKTTSFKMITGDTDISSGDVFVKGMNLKYNIKDVYKLIGYCPQFDALFDDLTGRETITVFGLLRGYNKLECNYIAENLAKRFDFIQHLDKKVKEMSGGNKRKLSTAVALIGDPPIIYLDEPTTGMDPATKRHLWNALCTLRDEGKCLILTTHSMEECEALCTRLAIMVNGQFKCLGSTQHLKNKFARGFSLTVKLKKQSDYQLSMTRLTEFIQTNFQSAVLHELHQEMATFSIPNSGLPWSKMFGIMERSKAELDIEDYSLGQSSLEQVFLKFTRGQMEASATV